MQKGIQPDCANDAAETCAPVQQSAATPGMWNPLPLFGDVQADHQLGNIQDLCRVLRGGQGRHAAGGELDHALGPDSEHPPASVHQGQAYVTSIINAAMKSPDWSSTAIFLAWDDWGGFYDHVVPPAVDRTATACGCPAIVISPYARQGYIDHQTLSSDAYLKFIEDDFLGGARLNPKTDGRPDPRPDVRENAPILGNLDRRLQLQPATPPAAAAADQPAHRFPHHPGLLQGQAALPGLHHPAAGTLTAGADSRDRGADRRDRGADRRDDALTAGHPGAR